MTLQLLCSFLLGFTTSAGDEKINTMINVAGIAKNREKSTTSIMRFITVEWT